MTVSTTKMSSRGQTVIPKNIRKKIRAKEGTLFAVIEEKNAIVLKKIKKPSKEEIIEKFTKMAEEGTKRAESLGLKEEDVLGLIERYRKEKRTKKDTLDTNILISARTWKTSVANKKIIQLLNKGHLLFTSDGILEETAHILKRDFCYDANKIKKDLDFLMNMLIKVTPTIKAKVVEDPDDNKIIECAIAPNSDTILTLD